MITQRFIWQGITAAAIIAAIVGGWATLRKATARQDTEPSPPVVSGKDSEAQNQVILPEAKLHAAHIRVEPVAMRELVQSRVVPGRLQYDDRRHVSIRAATAGIVVDVRVKPGDQVTKSQTLAVISSPEIGEARADVLKRQAEWEIAQRKHHWESQIESNLRPFVHAIKQRVDLKDFQKDFQSTTLGDYREKLTTAYTRLILAESLLKNTDPVSATGVLSVRTMQERTTERQAADAALLAACEQALFDAEQHRDTAALTAKDAGRRAEISRQHLKTLLGHDPGDENATVVAESDLSQAEVRAPFAGTIEQRSYSSSERVQPSDELFVLADTSTLWVVADIRERDWAAVAVQPGQAVSVRVPALPGRPITAKVHFVGREVSAANNAVSIVSEIENVDGMLRPGLFVEATFALGAIPQLAVPSSAVVTYEQESFVFIQQSPNTFRRVLVTCGQQNDEWCEILSGLKVGDPVVVEGAFVLKSELLLEPGE